MIFPTHQYFSFQCVIYTVIHNYYGHLFVIAISSARQLTCCCVLGQGNNLSLCVKFLPLLWIKHCKHQPPAHACVLLPHSTEELTSMNLHGWKKVDTVLCTHVKINIELLPERGMSPSDPFLHTPPPATHHHHCPTVPELATPHSPSPAKTSWFS